MGMECRAEHGWFGGDSVPIERLGLCYLKLKLKPVAQDLGRGFEERQS